VKTDSAFERFYTNEAKAVFTAVYLMCRDRQLAEDATQEAFARAFERWDRLERQPWAAGWVMTTALNCRQAEPPAAPGVADGSGRAEP
jgi:RNA polymerase sigma-70 factor (ECF subfamily)